MSALNSPVEIECGEWGCQPGSVTSLLRIPRYPWLEQLGPLAEFRAHEDVTFITLLFAFVKSVLLFGTIMQNRLLLLYCEWGEQCKEREREKRILYYIRIKI